MNLIWIVKYRLVANGGRRSKKFEDILAANTFANQVQRDPGLELISQNWELVEGGLA